MSVVMAVLAVTCWTAAVVVALKRSARIRRTADARLGWEYVVMLACLAAGWLCYWIGRS